MRRTEQAQGLRLMKFEEVYGRTRCGVLSQAVVKRVSSPPIGALTGCFSSIRGGQFSAPNNRR